MGAKCGRKYRKCRTSSRRISLGREKQGQQVGKGPVHQGRCKGRVQEGDVHQADEPG